MNENHLWNRAKQVQIQTSAEIVGGFDIGFDSKIPEETKDALMKFVYWVEDHFAFPVTLWVDFKYNHYLMEQNGKRVGCKFYWVDFANYPVFENPDDIQDDTMFTVIKGENEESLVRLVLNQEMTRY